MLSNLVSRFKGEAKSRQQRQADRPEATSSINQGFSYETLVRSKEIRLLFFEPFSDPDAPIALTVVPITLDEVRAGQLTIQHAALSYVWGERKHDVLIKLDGKDFYVSPNLESALRNVRAKAISFIWVDAISINQSDDVEKSQQVKLMGEIYSSIFMVVIWLGEATPESAIAIKHLDTHIYVRDGELEVNLAHTFKDPAYTAAWEAVGHDLLMRPWWRRIWTIQEVALTIRARVLCGQDMMMFQKLAIGTEYAFKNELRIFQGNEDGSTNLWSVTYRQGYRMRRAKGEILRLQELLMNSIPCFATDPRDMIFSLLGLATDVEDAEELSPDYSRSMSVEQVYTNVVKFQVRKYKCLDIICLSRHPKHHDNLPSWVPDFFNLKENNTHPLADFSKAAFEERYVYRASGYSILDSDVFGGGDNILQVLGIFVDKIAYIGVECLREYPVEHLASWSKLVLQHLGPNYISGCSVWEAINRTITADKARSGHRAIKGQRGFEAFTDDMEIPDTFRPDMKDPNERQELWQADSLQAMALRASHRRLIITVNGYIGLGPVCARKDDLVTIVLGCNLPVILREKKDQWHFVGESFVCGIMDGEILQSVDPDIHNGTKPGSADTSYETGYKIEKISIV
jgi:hypothetical protein